MQGTSTKVNADLAAFHGNFWKPLVDQGLLIHSTNMTHAFLEIDALKAIVRGEAVGLDSEVPCHPRMQTLVESLEDQLTFGDRSDPHWALGYHRSIRACPADSIWGPADRVPRITVEPVRSIWLDPIVEEASADLVDDTAEGNTSAAVTQAAALEHAIQHNALHEFIRFKEMAVSVASRAIFRQPIPS